MDQQQIKVRFSVGNKLLISIVLLLFLVTLFLNLSTIFAFTEDKRAYTYKTQSTEAILAGREFVTFGKEGLSTLKTLLASIDPREKIEKPQLNVLQSAIDNQNSIAAASIQIIDSQSGEARTLGKVGKAKDLKELELSPSDYDIPTNVMKELLPEIKKNSYAFVNLSKSGRTPALCAILADLNLQKGAGGIPVAIGLMPLKDFSRQLQNLKVTIATRNGRMLYDTDITAFFSNEGVYENPLFKAAAASTLENGAMEYTFRGTHYLGSYLSPGMDLIVITQIEWEKAMKATYTLIEKCILFGIMAVGTGIVFAILFSKSLTAPLGRLYDATKKIAGGNFELLLDEKGSDEISALSKSFNIMSKKISELIKESIQKVHLENELAIASTVQQTLIPPSEYKNDWIHIHSHYQPADQCGGDWWGFFGVQNRVAIMIADATGHGLPSALMTASARSCFSVMHKLALEDPNFSFSPSAMLSFANRVIYDSSLGKIMMTFFIAVIDRENHTLTYSNAGHNAPWLFRKQPDGSYSQMSLTVPGTRLGEARENDSFEEKTTKIETSDLLFLYTDGVIEGRNVAGEPYGKRNLLKVVEQALSGGPSKVVSNVIKDFTKYNESKPLDDDVTVATAILL